MNDKTKIYIGNFTTITNSLILAFAGLIIGVLTAFGLKLPFDEYSLSAIIGLIITTIFGYYNAKYKNTYFDDNTDTLTIDIDGLTEAQVQAIQNFINNANNLNKNNIQDIGPASEYEQDGGC